MGDNKSADKNSSSPNELKSEKLPDDNSSLDALRDLWKQDLIMQIRALLKLPMNKRTHFLRVRHPDGGTHL